MTDAIHITPFAPGYTEQVVDLILPIQREEFGIAITAADQPDLFDIPGFYQRGGGNFWLALHQGRVVGTIALLDIGDGLGALRKMFVHRDYRGKPFGAARALLDTLRGWAREQSMRAIYLGTTAKYLAAHRFYEKHGFREVAVAELPPAFPVMAVDTKFYAYEVV
ncbi:MAG: GNAT family N-acetyltransferase [Chloroflexales bacterium]|nr:GNAT family N-acetyltransferase [Chloroflexales bacterium]